MQLKDLAGPETLTDPRLDARHAFLAGIKAAFVVSQMTRLGQVLCSGCGHSWTGAEIAFESLTLCNMVDDRAEPGYDVKLGWGIDNPHNLKLCCGPCAERNALSEI